MCDPLTAAIVIGTVGLGATAYGSYKQADAYKQTAKAQSAIAQNNQVIADRQAEDRILQGKQEENNYRKRLEIIKGQQRSEFANSGVVVDSDTPFEILGETAKFGEIDALTIRNNAQRESYGYKVQGMNFGAQSSIYNAEAQNTNPWTNAGTTFLGGAGNLALLYANKGKNSNAGGVGVN